MAADTGNIDMTTDNQDLVSLTIAHHGKPHTISLPSTATISDLSESISATLSIPPSNQKLMISKLGLLKPPFKDPSLPITNLLDKKITLMGSTASEASSVAEGALAASRRVNATPPKQKVSAYKTHDWKKEQEEATYTFHTLRPLPYLPNPSRSLQFLQRLKDDAGIKASMRKHKFSVPLLTEMNPVEHTTSTHEGTSRTLGLNRNQGEVIELRLRTDARCVTSSRIACGGRTTGISGICARRSRRRLRGRIGGVAGERLGTRRNTMGEKWMIMGGGREGRVANAGQGMSRREILAKAAEERMRKVREEHNAREGEGA
ncbi:wlm domain-containing protein [Rutstroemia sp. NJR-2017a BBW]|nr:wlm domain-containing protein [Rutstroemia sp. NJR-2017a BBW]